MVFTNAFASIFSKFIVMLAPGLIILSLTIYAPSDILKYLKYFPSYFLYISSYINILQIYAICKTDDITWGTRNNQDDKNTKKTYKKSQKFQNFKYKKFIYLILYVFTNSFVGFLIQRYYLFRFNLNDIHSTVGVVYIGASFLLTVPFIGELIYVINNLFKLCYKQKKINPIPIIQAENKN